MKKMLLLNVVALVLALLLILTGSSCGSRNYCVAQFSSVTTGNHLSLSNASPGRDIAQSFTLSSSFESGASVSRVRAKLLKVGTLSAGTHVWVTLHADSGGAAYPNAQPNAAVLATSGTVLTDNLPTTTASDVTFTFPSPTPTLTYGTKYWLRFKKDFPSDNTNQVQFSAYDGATGGYSDGEATIESSTADLFDASSVGAYRDLAFAVGC